MMSFGAQTTTDEVLEGIDLTGQRFLVTGASAGLGVETTRALASHGAEVTMAVRNLDKGAAAMDEVRTTVPDAQLDLRELDLASLASIRTFASGFLEDHPTLDVLIGNAGVMACPQGTTVDGFETQFGTNHLGHFLLVQLLTPALTAAGHARVVLLTSAAHRMSDVDLDDPGWETKPYDAWEAYGRSKTANALCAVGLDHRLADHGVRGFAVHPGVIQTELTRHLNRETVTSFLKRQKPGDETVAKTIPQGAATTIYAAVSPDLDGQGALYLEDCGVAELTDDPLSRTGVRAYALDPDRADALWALSEQMVAETPR